MHYFLMYCDLYSGSFGPPPGRNCKFFCHSQKTHLLAIRTNGKHKRTKNRNIARCLRAFYVVKFFLLSI